MEIASKYNNIRTSLKEDNKLPANYAVTTHEQKELIQTFAKVFCEAENEELYEDLSDLYEELVYFKDNFILETETDQINAFENLLLEYRERFKLESE